MNTGYQRNTDLLEVDGVQEVEQIEQFAQIVVEWSTSQQYPVDRIECL